MSKQLPAIETLFTDVGQLIADARGRVAVAVNAEMSMLYWRVGKRINDEVLQGKRAEYRQQTIILLAQRLTEMFGKGWSEKSLRHCLRSAETFTETEILSAVQRQLSWTHIKSLMYLPDNLQRAFYMEMCILEQWSSRLLDDRIRSMLFERTAISKKPEKIIERELAGLKDNNRVSPELVFRDPYVLNFLGLSETYSEKDLEGAILAELQRFIIEMGSDFAFMARQKRITIDNRDYKIDLLFYHRRLKCLVAIDLKMGEFEAGHKGQMELYLRYLEKYEQVAGENAPVGLILCSGKNEEHVELMQLGQSNIRVSQYLTLLPPREVLQEKLHRAIEIAKNKLANSDEN
ncbi:MAG: cytoplasmic protein [Flavipsychrobacter sp.]|jgi:predicted nuclease of restriction endonuclease-like (RecB) superfamily|nr:cytoplasmic protein [Flavipsychrobacter sp.]